MKKYIELQFLRSVKTGKGLIKLITNLKRKRREEKVKGVKRKALTKKQRTLILAKTDSHCHICGIKVEENNFQADHVRSHSMGGGHEENNYLPSCSTCNNYRWHYTPEEILVILKLGVWTKTRIVNDPLLGKEIADEFIKYEMKLRKGRNKKDQL